MFERGLKSKMILQVHDELVFDVHPQEKETLEKLVKESMEGALKLSVPLEVEYKIAGNWLDAH
jgi:DNA polymerase-1